MPTYNIFLCYYWCKAILICFFYMIGNYFKIECVIQKVEDHAKFAFFGELFAVTLECSLEILISCYMSSKANLWKETGDIIGGIFAYLAMSLVVCVMTSIGVYIGI